MRNQWLSGLVLAAMAVAWAQAPPASKVEIEKLDPGLDAIVPADATLVKVADGFQFTEGPVWDHAGFLYFSDIPRAVVDKWTPDGKVTAFLGPAEFTLQGPAAGKPGTNGLTLDRQGRLTMCDQGNRRIDRLEKDGHITVLADRYEGKRFNSPNDLVYRSDGSLYFTDPPFGLPKGAGENKELPFSGVYRIAHGKVTLLIKDLAAPNGIAFGPGEHYLYVDNSAPPLVYMRYEVKPDGTLGAGKVFHDVSSAADKGVPDGMKVDQKGNVYAAGPGGIWIFSPEGKHLGTFRFPAGAANCGWGDPDGKALYITARTELYRIRLKIAGIRP